MRTLDKYKLYRSLYDIINPTISRKNISDYSIILDDAVLPIEVYYPKKDIKTDNIIIYIPSGNDTNNLYDELALNTNNLVVVLNYDDNKDNYYNSIRYIYTNLNKMIDDKNITIMTDNEGSNIEEYIIDKSIKTKDFKINKSILLEPTISLHKNTINKSLVVINQDSNNKSLNNYGFVEMYLNDFFEGNNTLLNNRIYTAINDYIMGG